MFDYRVIFAARGAWVRRLAAAGIAGGLFVTLAGSAQAQFFSWWGSPPAAGVPANTVIPPAKIYSIVTARGYRVSDGLQRNGRVYLADAVDQRGRALRLVIDAYQGDILQRFVTAPPRPAALIPPSQSRADLYPQYPSYPDTAAQPQVIPGIGHKTTDDARGSHAKKTQTVARGTGALTAEPARLGHAVPTEAVASQPAAGLEPATDTVPPVPPASSLKPVRPTTDGPGYANGVPINPLD